MNKRIWEREIKESIVVYIMAKWKGMEHDELMTTGCPLWKLAELGWWVLSSSQDKDVEQMLRHTYGIYTNIKLFSFYHKKILWWRISYFTNFNFVNVEILFTNEPRSLSPITTTNFRNLWPIYRNHARFILFLIFGSFICLYYQLPLCIGMQKD